MYENTIILGSGTHYFHFNTRGTAGAPITLAGNPSLACWVQDGPALTAGLTLSVDHGGVTGLHRVAFDVDHAALGLEDGDLVEIYLAQGTVDSISVQGTILARLSVSDGSLLPETAASIQGYMEQAISDAQLATAAALTSVANNVSAVLDDTSNSIPSQISGLNDLSSGQVRSQVDSALAAYDGVTRTDLQAAVSGLSTFDPSEDPVMVAEIAQAAIAAFWSTVRSTVNPPAGSFGAFLDAPVSSSGSGSGGDSAEVIADAVLRKALADHASVAGSLAEAVTHLRDRLTPSRAQALDNLDAQVSSRLARDDYEPAPTASQIAGQVWLHSEAEAVRRAAIFGGGVGSWSRSGNTITLRDESGTTVGSLTLTVDEEGQVTGLQFKAS